MKSFAASGGMENGGMDRVMRSLGLGAVEAVRRRPPRRRLP
jgi:hypothetical protein